MAKDLGKHRAVLLRGHGVAVVAEDVPSCVTLSLYLEENAKRLAYAMTIGDPQPYTDDEIRRVTASLWQPFVIEKTWIDAQGRARRSGALDDLRWRFSIRAAPRTSGSSPGTAAARRCERIARPAPPPSPS